jgi:hypothetical protein
MPPCDEKKESIARASHVRFRLVWRCINFIFFNCSYTPHGDGLWPKKEFKKRKCHTSKSKYVKELPNHFRASQAVAVLSGRSFFMSIVKGSKRRSVAIGSFLIAVRRRSRSRQLLSERELQLLILLNSWATRKCRKIQRYITWHSCDSKNSWHIVYRKICSITPRT